MNKIYLICMVLLISFLGCRESAIPSQSEQTVPRPVIISSDTGVEMDDIWTLAHVALSPEFDLLGVVTAPWTGHCRSNRGRDCKCPAGAS
jgi:hypothetical protein